MLLVRTMYDESGEQFETGVGWVISDTTGRLSVQDAEGNVLGIFAHGVWQSLRVCDPIMYYDSLM